jgi:hypothetical protein
MRSSARPAPRTFNPSRLNSRATVSAGIPGPSSRTSMVISDLVASYPVLTSIVPPPNRRSPGRIYRSAFPTSVVTAHAIFSASSRTTGGTLSAASTVSVTSTAAAWEAMTASFDNSSSRTSVAMRRMARASIATSWTDRADPSSVTVRPTTRPAEPRSSWTRALPASRIQVLSRCNPRDEGPRYLVVHPSPPALPRPVRSRFVIDSPRLPSTSIAWR